MALSDDEYAKRNAGKDYEPGGTTPFHRIEVPEDVFRKWKDPVDDIIFDDRAVRGFGFRCGCQDPERDAAGSSPGDFLKDMFSPKGLLFGLLGAVVVGLVGLALGGLGVLTNAGGQWWLAPALAAGGALLGGLIGAGGASGTGGSPMGAVIGTLVGAGAGAAVGAAMAAGPLAAMLVGAGVGLVAGMVGYALLKNKACKELVRTIPGWVHAENLRIRYLEPEQEKERELEGTLTGCYQTWTDVPLYQYHRYFDWNFHLKADEGFRYVGSEGGIKEGEELPEIECEWDTGAFSGIPGRETEADDSEPGASPEHHCAIFRDPPSSDEKDRILWPMKGQRAWLSGRWIYDCGHGKENHDITRLSEDEQKIEENALKKQLFRSELHPVKSMAFAQWEGVLFPDENNNKYVRGARFVFFASRIGGYHRFKDLKGRDYTFVVDLPPHPYASSLSYEVKPHASYPGCKIATTASSAAHKTGKAGSPPQKMAARATELLLRINTAPFNGMRGKKATAVKPTVVPVGPDKGKGLPTQVKITIPLGAQATPDDDCYGVIIDLAWKDDGAHTLADEIYKYNVTFHHITKLNVDHNPQGDIPSIEGPNEEWRIRYGVNGRWGESNEKDLKANGQLPLNKSFTLFLHKDDPLILNTHGTELDVVEEIFGRKKDDRIIKLDGQAVEYQKDFVRASPERRKDVAREIFDMMFWTFGDTSDPLGRFDHTWKPALDTWTIGRHDNKDSAAVALIEDHRLAETNEDPTGAQDYKVTYTIVVEKQLPSPGSAH